MSDTEPVVGAVDGYRWFAVRGDRLWSIGYGDHLWTPGQNQARCDRVKEQPSTRTVWVNDPDNPEGLIEQEEARPSGHGRIPAAQCTCGFYVLRDQPEGILGSSRGVRWNSNDDFAVVGRVLIWGRAIEHEDGYRAEYAAITGIVSDDPGHIGDLPLAPILRAYGIGSVPWRTRAEQGITTAYLIRVEGDRVKLDVVTRDSDEVIGWFNVAPGVAIPEPVVYVTARFTPDRVITHIRVHEEQEE